MAPKVSKAEKMIAYDQKLCELLDEYAGIGGGSGQCGFESAAEYTEGFEGGALLVLILSIPTKINKGTVEIITPVELIKKGDKVGSSEAALLSKLGIRPFTYGLVVISVYDNGSVFSPDVLDLTEDDLMVKFALGVSMVTSLSLAISYPSVAAAPHMFINAYKNVLAIAVETDYCFPQADKVEYLADPSKFAVAVAPVAAADSGAARLHRLLLLRKKRRKMNLLMSLTMTWVSVFSIKFMSVGCTLRLFSCEFHSLALCFLDG
ncbi:hypothetical protein BUALT_BualtUnG0031200 [Buddleja alternifolia]|uniref:Large ribosomal subunit protein uL10-like insertion domain-containing protein n=1 Tax=Buddleja alternifolia TaxID=168488 RepID=A0AAV6W0E3_9LAMI|nr:hypothetical protein BUALT_BualtUnG0031200 [Buddleja alternifolia]